LRITPTLPMTRYVDAFGNICTRVLGPKGELQISADGIVADTGLPDAVDPAARQHEVAELPHDTLVFLLGSRYCETDQLMNEVWSLFGKTAPGWPRVQAICDFVQSIVRFGYEHARATRTAVEVARERCGVCRDFAHLAITFCRCMNIPARYCTGYLATSARRLILIRWISVPGLKSISVGAGTRSTHATTPRASVAS
jgi:transglutaminase-like putative cysteine protease